MNRNDTIAAIATAPGPAGIAVVRVSGPGAFGIAERLAGKKPEPGRIQFARFSAAQPFGRATVRLDAGLVLAFKSPRSYTGEDTVEFQCHGGSVAPRRILEACIAAGARLARRGEYTERAFLNGNLDFNQAESVLDLIMAKTERAADAALEGIDGRQKATLQGIYAALIALSSTVEQALDISEDELPADFQKNIENSLLETISSIKDEVQRFKAGKILRDGALVVLAGAPNAGKSSLMNALLKENRAIVSDIPGTTRDSIEEWLDVEGWPVRLADTAGLRVAADILEREGVARAEKLVASADVVLALDCDLRAANVIRLHAKCDLGPGEGLPVSSKTGEGLEALRQAIARTLEAKAAATSETEPGPSFLTVLLSVLSDLSAPLPGDLVVIANRIRAAAEKLGEAVGAVYSQDLLDSLFSRFCVGK